MKVGPKYLLLLIATSVGLFYPDVPARAQMSEHASEWSTIGEPLYPMERDIFPGNSFTFARIRYTFRNRRWSYGDFGGLGEPGEPILRGFWATDYPESDENFSLRLSQITTLKVNKTEDGRFQHAIVRLDEETLFEYPFIYTCNVGFMDLTEPEQKGLRSYLLRGGFLMVDDFWGDHPWDNFVYQMAMVFGDEYYSLVQIPMDHEIFHIVFDVNEIPQVPDVGNFYASGGQNVPPPRDYSMYGTNPRVWGIFDENGRLMVIAGHNSDLGDGWEREGQNQEYFRTYSAPQAYPMGINIVVYAMTH